MEKYLEWVSNKTIWILLIPAFLVFSITLAVPIYLSQTSDQAWKMGYEINGAIGDFFGGVMNPIIALIALVWLVKGVSLQQIELAHTRKALEASEKHQANQVKISAMTALISTIIDEQVKLRAHAKTLEPELNARLEDHFDEQEMMGPGANLQMDLETMSLNDEFNAVHSSIQRYEEQKIQYFDMLKKILHQSDNSIEGPVNS